MALAVFLIRPTLLMPSVTRFIDGSGPVFAGPVFPFVCITIACGAVSGFHSLIASGTTPKMLARESRIRDIGYGAMVVGNDGRAHGDDRGLRARAGRIFRDQHQGRAGRSGREDQRGRLSGDRSRDAAARHQSRRERRCSAGRGERRRSRSAWRTCLRAFRPVRRRSRSGITSRSCSRRSSS